MVAVIYVNFCVFIFFTIDANVERGEIDLSNILFNFCILFDF